jgi:hypothetical protein
MAEQTLTQLLQSEMQSTQTPMVSLFLLHASVIPNLMRRNRRARGGPEGDIHIMGPVHPHRPPHNSTRHKLHTPHAKNTSSPRDCSIHRRWYVALGSWIISWRRRHTLAPSCIMDDIWGLWWHRRTRSSAWSGALRMRRCTMEHFVNERRYRTSLTPFRYGRRPRSATDGSGIGARCREF